MTSSLTVDAAYKEAVGHFNAERYADADRLCTGILQAVPDHIDALNLLGVIAQRVDRHDLAIDQFRRAIGIKDNIALLHFNLGISLQQTGETRDAVRSLEEALKRAPGNAMIAEALADMRRTASTGNRELLSQAIDHHQNGRLDDAIRLYREVIAADPENAVAHNNLGNAFLRQGMLDEAAAGFRQAISLQSDYADALSNLGFSLTERGRIDDALPPLRQAASLQPDHAGAHNNLSRALLMLGSVEEAAASSRKALDLQPDLADAHVNLGNALLKQGNRKEAVSRYRQAILLQPGHAEALNNLGNALLKQGRRDEAVACYQQALAANPGLEESRHMIDAIQGRATERAPQRYVRQLFDAFAGAFENRLVDDLGYRMPSLLKEVVMGLGEERFQNALDLGCGTGLSGVAFREMAERLVGIDLSERMIAEAGKKGIYDALYVDDMMAGMDAVGGVFDLVVSADALIYTGDLLPLFKRVVSRMTREGLFAFSTEHAEGDGFTLRETGRYAHSRAYVLATATASGFETVHAAQANLRRERNDWIVGGVYLLKRL